MGKVRNYCKGWGAIVVECLPSMPKVLVRFPDPQKETHSELDKEDVVLKLKRQTNPVSLTLRLVIWMLGFDSQLKLLNLNVFQFCVLKWGRKHYRADLLNI